MSSITVTYQTNGQTGTAEGDYRDVAHTIARAAAEANRGQRWEPAQAGYRPGHIDSATIELIAGVLRDQLLDAEVGYSANVNPMPHVQVQVTRSA